LRFSCCGVGLSAIPALAGASLIIAVDRTEAKRELARAFGATGARLRRTPSRPCALTGGRGGLRIRHRAARGAGAVPAVRPGGTLVLAGIAPMGSTTNFPGTADATGSGSSVRTTAALTRPATSRATPLYRAVSSTSAAHLSIRARSAQRGVCHDARRHHCPRPRRSTADEPLADASEEASAPKAPSRVGPTVPELLEQHLRPPAALVVSGVSGGRSSGVPSETCPS
jgi:hypothetical protein